MSEDRMRDVLHGQCCAGINSTYNIVVGRSARVQGPYLDRNGVPMLQGGGTMLADYDAHPPFHGPGHFGVCWGCGDSGEDVVSFHYDTPPGHPGFDTAAFFPLRWDAEGWPRVEW